MVTLVEAALAEHAAGRPDEAGQLFTEAVRRRQDAEVAWAWIAHRAADADDWRAALRACNAALAAGDPPWWTFHIKGVALTRLGRASEAVLPLQRAASAAPEELAVAVAQVRCGVAMRDLALARSALMRAEAISEGAPQTRRAKALVALAEQRYSDAEAIARSLLLDDLLDIEALTNLGVALIAQGAESEARPFFRDAVKHGEVTPFHRLTHANFRRLDRRVPVPAAPRTRRPLGILQFSVLRWLLVIAVAIALVRGNPVVGVITLGAAAFAYPLIRKHRPAPVYRAMPDYVRLTVTAGPGART